MKNYSASNSAWMAVNGLKRVQVYDYLGQRRTHYVDHNAHIKLKRARRILSEG